MEAVARTPLGGVPRFGKQLLDLIGEGELDTTFLISHHASIEDGPEMYRHWHDEQNDYTKIVLRPAIAKGDVKSGQREVEHV